MAGTTRYGSPHRGTAIICTNGFSIYKDADKQELIKSLAEKTGIIILTDSDSAGFQIRSFIRSIVKRERC